MDILKEFGKRVRKRRLELNISQEQLSFKAGLHRTYIGAVERGEKNISLKNIKKLAKALNISINGLFGESL